MDLEPRHYEANKDAQQAQVAAVRQLSFGPSVSDQHADCGQWLGSVRIRLMRRTRQAQAEVLLIALEPQRATVCTPPPAPVLLLGAIAKQMLWHLVLMADTHDRVDELLHVFLLVQLLFQLQVLCLELHALLLRLL